MSISGSSRNKSFEKMIMTNTKGKGVDLVLNSLAGDLLQASIRCLAQGGRFLEIGKVDLVERTPIDSNIFLKNASFHGIVVEDAHTAPFKEYLHKLLTDGMYANCGVLLQSIIPQLTPIIQCLFQF